MPSCDEYVYKEFSPIFSDTTKALENLNYETKKITSNEGANFYNLKMQADLAKKSLGKLKSFTQQNLEKVDTAFEKALFDTNLIGIVAGITIPLTIWFISTDDKLFHHKIDRAYNNIVDLSGELEEIYNFI